MRFLPLFFILLPVLELLVLIEVGEAIGGLLTVALVILGVIVGVKVVKRQGWTTLRRANERLRMGQLPAQEMLEGFLLALGGLLLMVPGFISDAGGLLLLLPPLRRRLVKALIGSGRVSVQGVPPGFGQSPFGAEGTRREAGPGVYEGEYTREQSSDRRLEDGDPRE